MMRKYEKYKDSGVEWIGEVPEHWNKCRLKFNCCLKGRIGWNGLRSDEFETDSYAYLVTGQDFNSSDIEWSKCYQLNKNRYEEDPFIQLKNGDLLITKDGTIGKIAKVSNMDKSACLNSGIFVMKQKSKKNEFTQGFLYWLLCSDLFKAFNQYTTTGTTILHLYQNVFENMPLLIPSLPEQQSIASYLDSKVGEIDNMIEKTEKKIKLYEELKKSIITRAVTKGLNPNAKMKDSGVEWIGEVPEHWEAMKVTWIYQLIGSGTTPKTDKEYYYCENGEYWLQTGDLNDGIIRNTSKQITKECVKELNFKIYPKGSLVVAMYGATIGKVGLLNIETTTNQACCVLAKSSIMLSKFSYFVFIAAKQSLILKSSGGGQPNISQDKIRNHYLPVPSIDEQCNIVEYLDSKTSTIDSQISITHKRIDLLKELKSSLITNVVTGKIKVC